MLPVGAPSNPILDVRRVDAQLVKLEGQIIRLSRVKMKLLASFPFPLGASDPRRDVDHSRLSYVLYAHGHPQRVIGLVVSENKIMLGLQVVNASVSFASK